MSAKTVNMGKIIIEGNVNGRRLSSRVLEEEVQKAVKNGARDILIKADGQHGIGGRIWPREEPKKEIIRITVEGPSGQRLGSMGMFGTEIILRGSAGDDVGWINCGARITVLGDVTNGAHNAAAQGVLYVQGGGGARCDTMTKHNPRFTPPESWYLRDVGDSFAEFKAGGIAVVCGINPRNPENILGYRPCIGMVGGTIYFRGHIKGFSERDVKLLNLSPEDWKWLKEHMKPFLNAIDRDSYYKELTHSPNDWRKLIAYTPHEKRAWKRIKTSVAEFKTEMWEREVGMGGIFAEYLSHEETLLPYITTGSDRRNKPMWLNEKYAPPCAYACPTHIPTHKRTALLRNGKYKEALSLVLQYSPLPATVCGEICPNLCMENCTRARFDRPLNIKGLGSLSLNIPAPRPAPKTGYKIAVIGGGPGGLSSAWQLRLKGHEVALYEAEDRLGGKIELCIPGERLPHKILLKELARFKDIGVRVHLGEKINQKDFEKIYKSHDAVIVAVGAHKPMRLEFPGSKYAVPAIEFLKDINSGKTANLKNKDIVVIGAGNVGMDAAAQAFKAGARAVAAVDIQKPAAFGRELEMAKLKGTEILWPRFVKSYEAKSKKLHFTDGSSINADLVIVSVGEVPVLDFLTPDIHTEKGRIVVSDIGQTSDVKVYAVGDAVMPGLVTHAIGQGRIAAEAIHSGLMHYTRMPEPKEVIPYERIKTEYYEGLQTPVSKKARPIAKAEAALCMSCGACRDCHMCEAVCYPAAISRIEKKGSATPYEYAVDEDKCIGCGFCAGVCPCGVWEMTENV